MICPTMLGTPEEILGVNPVEGLVHNVAGSCYMQLEQRQWQGLDEQQLPPEEDRVGEENP